MNMTNDIKPETGSVFARAYEINAHTMAVVNAAIAAGVVTADKVPEMIRNVHRAFADGYAMTEGFVPSVEGLAAGTSLATPAPEAVAEAPQPAEEAVSETAEVAETAPAAPARRKYPSLFADPEDAIEDDQIRCLIDGVGRKMLTRYLRQKYGMEWDEYLEMFNLRKDYPTVAPKYSASKKAEALALGLGSTVPKTPRALRALEASKAAETPRSTSERRRRQRDPQLSGRIAATPAKVA